MLHCDAKGLGAVAGCPSRTVFLPTGAAVCPHFSVMFKGGTSSGTTGSFGRLWYDEIRCTVTFTLSYVYTTCTHFPLLKICKGIVLYTSMWYVVRCILHSHALHGSNDDAHAEPCAIHVTGPMSHHCPGISQFLYLLTCHQSSLALATSLLHHVDSVLQSAALHACVILCNTAGAVCLTALLLLNTGPCIPDSNKRHVSND